MKQYNDKSLYGRAKSAFIDRIVSQEFVRLQTNIVIWEKLLAYYQQPFKILVLYGEPGVGKTHLLKRFENEIKERHLFALYHPSLQLAEFRKELSRTIFAKEVDLFVPPKKGRYTIIIDEAQLLNDEQLEFIRLLSDTQHYRFILALHNLHPEQTLARAHFHTRIHDFLQLQPPSLADFETYVKQKLFYYDLLELSKEFNKRSLKRIYHYTKGNLRKTNRFFFTLFDMLHYFENEHPHILHRHTMKDFLQVCALHLGYE